MFSLNRFNFKTTVLHRFFMPNDPQRVFISYAWGGESEIVANEIDQAITSIGINLIRDKRDLGFKGLIKEFMEEIGQGNAVILVISDKYLKSPNCMFELLEVQKSGDFYNRVFPLVLPDATIYKSTGIISYLKYWEDQIEELNEAIKGLDSFADTQGIRDDIDLFTDIRGAIASIATTFRNMNTLTVAEMRAKAFRPLVELLGKRVSADTNTEEKPKSKHGKVLYHIPELMQVQQWTRCTVRLAWDEILLKENLKLPDESQVVDDIRLGEVMQVCIEEGRESESFEIKSLSSTEQIILVDDYTEWLFDVKPEREGSFTLVLRVTLLQIIEGFGERKKDIVLERKVTTKALAPESLPVFEVASTPLVKQATSEFTNRQPKTAAAEKAPFESQSSEPTIFAAPIPQSAPSSKRPKSVLRKLMPYAASLSILITVGVFLLYNSNSELDSNGIVASTESPSMAYPDEIQYQGNSGNGAPPAFDKQKLLLVVYDPSQSNLPESEQTPLLFLANMDAIDSLRLDSMYVDVRAAQDTSLLPGIHLSTYSASRIEDSVRRYRRSSKNARPNLQLTQPAIRSNAN